MPSLLSLGIILALLIINGFFVAAEFALLGAPRAVVETKAREGNRVALLIRLIQRNVRHQDRYIATAQLGITLASLGLGAYGEHVLAEWFEAIMGRFGAGHWAWAHGLATALSIASLTYLHIVLGEMIPKSLALQEPWKTAAWITPVMQGTLRVVLPVVVFLNAVGNRILKWMGIDRNAGGTHGYHSSQELQYIVEESRERGQLTSDAGRLLQEIFDFDQLLAREVLVPRVRVTAIPVGAGPTELARIFRQSPHTRYPVYRETVDKIVGSMHVQDLFARIRDGRPVAEVDVRPVPFVPETASLNQVLEAMRKEKTQLCVILDEFGGTEGVISLSDLFREVVGKVPEGALQVGEVIEDGQGRLLVAGTVRLNELEEKTGAALEHEEVDTVSGLILHLLGRPPVLGDKLEYGGLVFRVTSTVGKGVRWAEVIRFRNEEAGEGPQPASE